MHQFDSQARTHPTLCHKSPVTNLCPGIERRLQGVAEEATFHAVVSSMVRMALSSAPVRPAVYIR